MNTGGTAISWIRLLVRKAKCRCHLVSNTFTRRTTTIKYSEGLAQPATVVIPRRSYIGIG